MKLYVAAIIGALGVWYLYDPGVDVIETASQIAPAQNPLRGAQSLVVQEAARKLDFSELDKPFSKSTEGTEIAGRLTLDDNGDLIIDDQLKAYFDYFLSAVGQVTPEDAIRRLHLLFTKNLPEQAAQQAMATLEGYLAFKEASFDLMAQPIDRERASSDAEYRVQRLEYGLNTLKTLRREHMEADAADAFFKEDESFADYTLANQKIALDDSLTIAERRELRAQARTVLPEEMAEIAQRQEEQAFKQQGLQELIKEQADVKEIAQYAYENFTPEEAEGLVEHYEQQAQMKAQYNVYRDQVSQLQKQGLSEADFNQAKDNLANQYFTPDQVSMVKAWDLGMAQNTAVVDSE